jgi:hypothetical protein
MKHNFTPPLLWSVNNVKYDVKRQKYVLKKLKMCYLLGIICLIHQHMLSINNKNIIAIPES